ncbi:MAG: hypothetical protein JXB62_15335 [Pirellulales bacterium]|nr:hypothetical protein [Pirellulales bacterium]
MNPTEQPKPNLDDRRFDLLVDGELGEADRRELLAGLDDEPSGWRRCALAFLEAQAWKHEFGSILQESPKRQTAEPLVRRWRFGGRGTTLAAMAASFLVALLLGLQWEKFRQSPGPAGLLPTEVAGGPTAAGPAVTEQPLGPGDASPLGQPADEPSSPWQVVTLGAPGGALGDSEAFRLPARQRDRIDSQWLEALPAPVPPEVLQQFIENGHRIERRRELVPYRMQDGSQLVVPVDKYEVQYVGRPSL